MQNDRKRLFSAHNIDMVSSIMDEYAFYLEDVKAYEILTDKNLELLESLETNLSGNNLELFQEFIKNNMKIASFDNTLAYFLGIKLIDDCRKIKEV